MERVMSSAPEGILQHAVIDERKRKRMESNRESARRSRLRKQQCLDDLIREVSQLQQGNIQITEKINAAEQIYMEVASENNVLNAQITELTDRLQSLNEVVYFVEEASGFAMDIPEISNFLLEPWQLSCPEQTILASTNMLQY